MQSEARVDGTVQLRDAEAGSTRRASGVPGPFRGHARSATQNGANVHRRERQGIYWGRDRERRPALQRLRAEGEVGFMSERDRQILNSAWNAI